MVSLGYDFEPFAKQFTLPTDSSSNPNEIDTLTSCVATLVPIGFSAIARKLIHAQKTIRSVYRHASSILRL